MRETIIEQLDFTKAKLKLIKERIENANKREHADEVGAYTSYEMALDSLDEAINSIRDEEFCVFEGCSGVYVSSYLNEDIRNRIKECEQGEQ